MAFTISCKEFKALSPEEVYQILRLRSEVFVVEQKCIFLDPDNKDQRCYHVMIWSGNLLACSRLVPPGVSYAEMSIGRVVNHPSTRGTGVGKVLMEQSLMFIYEKYGAGPVRIGAQLYLKKFYESFGFTQSGEVYDEDGIDHIEMIKP